MNRICLFAGFDKHGIVDDYVVYYVQELSKLADVYYLADCVMMDGELEKLSQYVKNSDAFRHEKYDFGSWQELMNKIGWEKIREYDELILANDSCYGPVYPLEPIFARMEEKEIDFWGMTQNGEISPHVQSYFLVFNKNVLQSDVLKDFFAQIKKEHKKMDVVKAYEVPNTSNLVKHGFKFDTVFPKEFNDNPTCFWATCLNEGVPLFKICNLTNLKHSRQYVFGVQKYISDNTKYNYSLIANHLQRIGVNLLKFSIFHVFVKLLRDLKRPVKKQLKKMGFLREK